MNNNIEEEIVMLNSKVLSELKQRIEDSLRLSWVYDKSLRTNIAEINRRLGHKVMVVKERDNFSVSLFKITNCDTPIIVRNIPITDRDLVKKISESFYLWSNYSLSITEIEELDLMVSIIKGNEL